MFENWEQQRAEQFERDSRGVIRLRAQVVTRSKNDRRNDGVMRLDSPRSLLYFWLWSE